MEDDSDYNPRIQDPTRLNWLDKDNYDVIVLGTGFVESLIAGYFVYLYLSLSRAGKNVLHLDKNDYYGGYASSFTLNQLDKLLTKANEEKKEEEDLVATVHNINNDTVAPQFKNIKVYKKEKKQVVVVTPPTTTTTTTTTTQDNDIEKKEGEEDVKQQEETKQEVVVEEKPKQEEQLEEEEDIFKKGRQYIIDITPSLIYSRGPLVSLLISSMTSKYLDFKCPEQNYLFLKDAIQKIPSTKGSIFKDSIFSLKDKRSIMKFIDSIKSIREENEPKQEEGESQQQQDDESKEKKTGGEYEELKRKYGKFIEYIDSFALSQHVKLFILYGLSLIHQDIENITFEQGIQSVGLYISSLLVYGPTPFLVPFYGYGEIPQAFCRLCAVFGGTYVLDRSAKDILFTEPNDSNNQTSKYRGITCTEGQTITSTHFITTPRYLNPSSFSISNQFITKTYSRAICIVDKIIEGTESYSFLTIPPGSIGGNKQTINMNQMDKLCVPMEKTLIHFTTLATGTAEEDLKSVVEHFLQYDSTATTTDSKDSKKKPTILWSAYFNIDLDYVKESDSGSTFDNTTGLLPEGMIICSDAPISSTIDYQSQISQAKFIFEKICPGQTFLERVPDAEDIIWGGEDTTTSTTTTTTTANETEPTTTATTTNENETTPTAATTTTTNNENPTTEEHQS
ncbi:Rab escort protein [Cavenderia fasciculata]|uniref:Rab escort protein n=1 Tax=Cavenderia fasciculata TaxID=261658 RepID=F4PWL1_CACFS|nr:Rab escort protein [Cavenderia fasciculata]EGG20375.1 Rab escort protein [Cavenderia fasciculata]|eukprot:XP_004367358.1 Rab escort protein [Cavenderia fasciculata]